MRNDALSRRSFLQLGSAITGLAAGVETAVTVIAGEPADPTESSRVARAWSREVYERSVSSRCWWYTPYDGGWGPGLAADDELEQIVAMERWLGEIPGWAKEIVERSINFAAPCGHHTFPRPYLETLDAIGDERPPVMVHGCFTVRRERKEQVLDYCLCLDAWLEGAPPEVPARELRSLGHRKIDWLSVCRDLWRVLGERTEAKELLVERLLHQIRHALKATAWEDDRRAAYGDGAYLGDFDPKASWGIYGNRGSEIPGFQEDGSPRVQRLNERIDAVCSKESRPNLGEWWLCAPKSLRFLERQLWIAGQGRSPANGEEIPGFLRCDETYPSQDEAARWWAGFTVALNEWWQNRPAEGETAKDVSARLGETTPVKRWLVRLFLRKLNRLDENGEQFHHLVHADHPHRRGTRPLEI